MKEIYDVLDAAALCGSIDNLDLSKYDKTYKCTITDICYNLYRIGTCTVEGTIVGLADEAAIIDSFDCVIDQTSDRSHAQVSLCYYSDYTDSHFYGIIILYDNELYFATPEMMAKQDELKVIRKFQIRTGFNIETITNMNAPWFYEANISVKQYIWLSIKGD